MPGAAAPARPFDRAAAFEDLRARLFTPSTADRVGLEAELIALDATHRLPAPIFPHDASRGEPATLDVVRRLGSARGWSESESPYGSPRFRTPAGGTVSFEPGGQVEWSSTPASSVEAVVAEGQRVMGALAEAAESAGIVLIFRGIDPVNSLERSPLRLASRRYARMADYLDRWSPHGATMMRQCAALHLNLDFGERPSRRWQAATAVTPLLLAIFANSPLYRGAPTGHRSFRAHQWRRFDPRRSGLLPGRDAPEALFERALAAGDFLSDREVGESPSVAERLDAGTMTRGEWRAHLSTFFPELRPRGYMELRAVDALPPRWYGAPLVFLTGLLYDDSALEWTLRALPEPTEEALEAAGRTGLRDPGLASVARSVFRQALAGAERLGVDFTGSEPLAAAAEFFERFTQRGRDPGDDPEA
jgi:glutamate--cysteine ligase